MCVIGERECVDEERHAWKVRIEVCASSPNKAQWAPIIDACDGREAAAGGATGQRGNGATGHARRRTEKEMEVKGKRVVGGGGRRGRIGRVVREGRCSYVGLRAGTWDGCAV